MSFFTSFSIIGNGVAAPNVFAHDEKEKKIVFSNIHDYRAANMAPSALRTGFP